MVAAQRPINLVTCGPIRRAGAARLQSARQNAHQCQLAVGDQPAPDAFGNLTGRCVAQLGRVLAAPANPVAFAKWMAYPFDAMRGGSAFQADVSWTSGHV